MFRRNFIRIARQFVKLRVLGRRNMLSKLSDKEVIRFNSGESFEFKALNVGSQSIPDIFSNYIGKHSLESPFVAVLSEAYLVGNNAVAVYRQHVVMESVVGRWYVLERSELLKVLLNQFIFNDRKIDIACSLVNDWSRNYFHWITECLTRLEGIEIYKNQFETSKPILIIDKNPTPWQIESLSLLGYPPEDCLEWHFSKATVRKLLVPSVRRYQEKSWYGERFTDITSPSACKWLRQKLFDRLGICGVNASPQKRIFISRNKAPTRKTLNEIEIMESLSPWGFKSYVLEDLSFSEQVKLFAEAETVIAPHGAGLTNILFCQQTTVIELFGNPHFIRADYFQLSRCLDLNYYFIMCDYKDLDINVDIYQLTNLLKEVM